VDLKNEIVVFSKNRDLMKVSTKNLNLVQLKAFNYIAYKIKKELMVDGKKQEFSFSHSEIIDKCDLKKKSNKYLYEVLQELVTTKVFLYQDTRNWAYFTLLSSIVKSRGRLNIGVSVPMSQCLLENNYAPINLETMKSFKSKYTVLLYELYKKFENINFPILTIQEFKEWFGIQDKKTYKNFAQIRNKILTPAILELREKEDMHLKYSLKKNGMAYETIQFYRDIISEEGLVIPENLDF